MTISGQLPAQKKHMNSKIHTIIRLMAFAFIAFFVVSVHADPNPHYYIPTSSTPPSPPEPGQPGYGQANAYANGVYYDSGSGLWVIPDGLWQGNDASRDVYFPDDPPPPSRPDWAISDAESDGTYYWMGGYYNGHYFGAGYYFPNEIW